ncbi:MAG: hypothetical protein LBV33_08525 [Lachnospiraceae bacterium]|jgi:hypothetical protein|nr:hypothetical protein [Lachnospiraceae bacterium]
MKRETKDIDRIIMTIIDQYKKEKYHNQPLTSDEMQIGCETVLLRPVPIFVIAGFPDGLFSMKLPNEMNDMDPISVRVKYPSDRRPQVIKSNRSNNICFTFSVLGTASTDRVTDVDVEMQLAKAKSVIKAINQSHVIYDEGRVSAKDAPILWFDYRGYAVDGNYYDLLFMFRLDDLIVLGNFQCEFEAYHIWKHAVLKLLGTIEFTVLTEGQEPEKEKPFEGDSGLKEGDAVEDDQWSEDEWFCEEGKPLKLDRKG